MYEAKQKGLRSSYSSCTILPLASEHGASWSTEGLARQLWPATLTSPLLHEAYAHGPFIIVDFQSGLLHFFVSEYLMSAMLPAYESSE